MDKVVTVLAETINASGGESHWSEDGWAVEDGARRGSLVERARDILR